MRIWISGASSWQKTHVKGLVRWYADTYIPRKQRDLLHVSIKICGGMLECGNIGTCQLTRERKGFDPWLINIELANAPGTSRYQLLKTTAHECVHARQYVTKQLVDTSKGTKFQRYYFSDKQIERDYYFLPWEISAYGQEHALTLKYCKGADIVKTVMPYSLMRHM